MTKKKWLSIVMVCALTFTLAGCGRDETESREAGNDNTAEESAAEQDTEGTGETVSESLQEAETDEAEQVTADLESSMADEAEVESAVADGGNALVAYFSWSGNTENVANAIAEQTGADVFRIVPGEAYTDDYNTLLEIATEEKENGVRPAVAGSIEDIAQYDIIYVGYAGGIIGLN